MPGVGIGGLVSNLMNPGLDDTIAKQITPNPSPLAQQGQGQPSGQGAGATADQTGNPFAKAQVTQQDPVVASLAENLVRAQRQSMFAADLNRNIAGVAAGFGTAQQQASKQAALNGMPGAADEMGMWKDIQGIQQTQTDQNEHARFMGSMAVFAKSLSTALGRPVSVEEATMIANSPDMMKASAGATQANETFTPTTKDADQATRSWADANPNATPQQIAAYRAGIIAMGSGSNMEDQAYRAYAQAEIAAGRTPDDILTWKNKHATAADISKTQGTDAQKFKDLGTQDFETAHQKVVLGQTQVDKLLSNMDATMAALKYPSLLTTSGLAAGLPDWNVGGYGLPDEATKQAAVAAQTLVANLTGESLSTIKNLRNGREFATLGQAATGALNANLGREGVQKALEAIKKKFDTADANAYAVAGKQIPNQYNGLADERYLNKTWEGIDNPYYTGATYEPPDSKTKSGDGSQAAPPAGGGGSGGGGSGGGLTSLEGPALDRVKAAIAKNPGNKAKILDTVRKNGFDPGNL
jgi:hypothetical protein